MTSSRTSRFIHTTRVILFWEHDHKGRYLQDKPKHATTELIRDGLKELKGEIMLWKDEMKEQFEGDPILAYRRGECWHLYGKVYTVSLHDVSVYTTVHPDILLIKSTHTQIIIHIHTQHNSSGMGQSIQ
jgi:hypothetical protein